MQKPDSTIEKKLKNLRHRFMDDWFSQNTLAYFLVICLLYIVAYLLKRMFIIDQIAAFEILSDRGEMWVINLFFDLQYLSVPLFLAWKFTITALILWLGCFLFGYRVTYAQLWKLVMVMEIIFIIPELTKVLWFTIIYTDPSYQDITAFYPLSLINLFHHTNLHPKWHYPLKALNIFEVIYWGLLIAGVFWLSGKKLKISTAIVSSSYILFFILWLIYYLIIFKN